MQQENVVLAHERPLILPGLPFWSRLVSANVMVIRKAYPFVKEDAFIDHGQHRHVLQIQAPRRAVRREEPRYQHYDDVRVNPASFRGLGEVIEKVHHKAPYYDRISPFVTYLKESNTAVYMEMWENTIKYLLKMFQIDENRIAISDTTGGGDTYKEQIEQEYNYILGEHVNPVHLFSPDQVKSYYSQPVNQETDPKADQQLVNVPQEERTLLGLLAYEPDPIAVIERSCVTVRVLDFIQ